MMVATSAIFAPSLIGASFSLPTKSDGPHAAMPDASAKLARVNAFLRVVRRTKSVDI